MKKILLRLLMALGAFILLLVINYIIFSITATQITEGVPISSKGSGNTALLVIDIQEAYTGELSVTEGYKQQSEVFITHVNQLVEEARENNNMVIYVKSEVVNPLLNLINNSIARGSEGAAFDRRLISGSDHIVSKRKSDSFNGTSLDQILVENRVERLVVLGLDAEHCVFSTIQAALNRDYEVAVVPEGVLAVEEADKVRMISEYRQLGVEIL